MADPSDRSSAGPFTLALRAAFVPDGEQPPPEFAADFSPLKFRATLDRTTGAITCENAGMTFDGDIRAEWHPDEAQSSGTEQAGHDDDPAGNDQPNGPVQPLGPAGSVSNGPLRDVSPARSTPLQSQTARTPDSGVPARLPDGQTIADPNSPTGRLMSPVADLGPVAKAGQQAGADYRSMLDNPESAEGAATFLGASLGAAVGPGGTFDYQRRGNRITGFTQLRQFKDVSNVNVGLFAQQAGLTLDETLRIAEAFEHFDTNNAKPDQPHGLDPRTAQFVTTGFNLGQSGAFDNLITP